MNRGLAILLVSGLAGCANVPGKPVIENRFKRLDEAASARTAETLQLAVSSTTASDKADSVAITALSDRGQAALITALKGEAPTELKGQDDDAGAPRVVEHATLSRRLVVAIRPKAFLKPGDRLEAFMLTLEVAPDQKADWRFQSWSQATNGKVAIEVGKLVLTRSLKQTAEGGFNLGNSPVDQKVSVEANQEHVESATINGDGEFNAAVDPLSGAWLDDSGGYRENLARNYSIDAVVVADFAQMTDKHLVQLSPLRTPAKAGAPEKLTPPLEVYLAETLDFRPTKTDKPVCGVATLHYRMRNIVTGQETFSEADDVAGLPINTISADFMIAPPPYQPAYGVRVGDKDLHYLRTGAGRPAGLRFATLKQAEEFVDWLRDAAPRDDKIANAEIGLLDDALQIHPLSTPERRAMMAGVLDPEGYAKAQLAGLKACGASILAAPPAAG